MLTLGSHQQNIDFEPKWRKKMKAFPGAADAPNRHKGDAPRSASPDLAVDKQSVIAGDSVSVWHELCDDSSVMLALHHAALRHAALHHAALHQAVLHHAALHHAALHHAALH